MRQWLFWTRLFVCWYAYDAYAPKLFNEAGAIAATSGFAGCGVAVIGSLWRARQNKNVTTYGSSRWATLREIEDAGLFRPAGVFLGQLAHRYLRHDGPEHVMAFAPTRSGSHVDEGTYITSVKIPALGMIFDQDYSKQTLAQVAKDVSRRTGNPKVEALVLSETGFTNIRNTYRNSSTLWMRKYYKRVLPLLKTAYALRTDAEGRSLAEKIGGLPPINRPAQSSSAMHPENFLTPVMFALGHQLIRSHPNSD